MDGYIFDDGLVKVGNGILWVAGTTYPVRSINSIRATGTNNKPIRILGAIIVLLFIYVTGAIFYNGDMEQVTFVLCTLAMLGGAVMFRNKDKYKLFVNTIGGEKQVLVSDDKDYVRKVRACIEECISSEAGGPARHGASRMGPTIDGTLRRDDGLLPRS